MQLRSLLEISTLISAASPHLVEAKSSLSQETFRRLWCATRARSRSWLSCLSAYPADIARSSPSQRQLVWDRTAAVLSDIFIADIVIRLWTAILAAHDRSTWSGRKEGLARLLFLQQLEARREALQFMVDAPFVTLAQIAEVDRLRRRLERWSDLLVGHLVRRYQLSDFAFDLDRANDFGEEQLRDNGSNHRVGVWEMYLVCLRSTFPRIPLPNPVYRNLHVETLTAILGAFPRSAFTDEGPLRAVRMRRLIQSSLHPEGPVSPASRVVRS